MEFLGQGSARDYILANEPTINNLQLLSMYLSPSIHSLSRACQSAAGMKYLAKNKIIHRDLALRNLLVSLVDGSLVIKVADFGLSARLKNEVIQEKSSVVFPIKWYFFCCRLIL
jgi:serine/threonine protein kinase